MVRGKQASEQTEKKLLSPKADRVMPTAMAMPKAVMPTAMAMPCAVGTEEDAPGCPL